MPISFKCSCGKAIRVPDEYVGKRIKCPGCGEAKTVEAEGGTPAAPGAPATVGMIRFSCSCGKQMQTKTDHAGTIVDCPSCGAEVTVPGSASKQEAISSNPSATAAPAPARGGDDLDDFRPSRKAGRKSGGGSKLGLWLGLTLGLLLLIGAGFAAWWFWSGSLPEDLELVPADAVGFGTVRVADLWESESVQNAWKEVPDGQKKELTELEEKFGLKITDVERVTMVMNSVPEPSAKGPPDMWVIVHFSKAYDFDKIKGVIEKEANDTLSEATHNDTKYFVSSKRDKSALLSISEETLVFAPEVGMKACIDHMKDKRTSGPLKDALRAAKGKDHLFFAMAPSSDLKSKASDLGGMGGGMSVAFLKKLVVGTFSANVSSELALKLTMEFEDEESAGEAKTMLDQVKGLAQLFLGNVKDPNASKIAGDALSSLKIEQDDEEVVTSMTITLDPEILKPAVDNAMKEVLGGAFNPGGFGRRTVINNNLKQIGLAMHSYHDQHRTFPTQAITDPSGKPLLSWRVAILPMIEQENLYQQIRKDEPWDSPHNKQFWNQMPKIYSRDGAEAAAGDDQTNIMVFTGKDTPFDGDKGKRFTQFTDGTSNTILVIESGKSVNWMKPEDIPFTAQPNGRNPEDLLFFAPGGDHYLAVLGDGSTRRIPASIDPKTFQNLVLINDGNIVNFD